MELNLNNDYFFTRYMDSHHLWELNDIAINIFRAVMLSIQVL